MSGVCMCVFPGKGGMDGMTDCAEGKWGWVCWPIKDQCLIYSWGTEEDSWAILGRAIFYVVMG